MKEPILITRSSIHFAAILVFVYLNKTLSVKTFRSGVGFAMPIHVYKLKVTG